MSIIDISFVFLISCIVFSPSYSVSHNYNFSFFASLGVLFNSCFSDSRQLRSFYLKNPVNYFLIFREPRNFVPLLFIPNLGRELIIQMATDQMIGLQSRAANSKGLVGQTRKDKQTTFLAELNFELTKLNFTFLKTFLALHTLFF